LEGKLKDEGVSVFIALLLPGTLFWFITPVLLKRGNPG
jgi:hypothetical protein